MSKFEVNVVKIDSVEDHPDADRLSIVKIAGYNCISAKLEDGSHRYKAGYLVVYIPEGALLPEWVLKKLGFWNEEKQKGTLSGSKGNRVKAIKLRGIFSQGVLYGLFNQHFDKAGVLWGTLEGGDTHIPCQDAPMMTFTLASAGQDVAEFLSITKYEPTIPAQMKGIIRGGLFGHTVSYDIENLQKYTDVFEDGEMVVATEKIHGTLCQIGISNNLPEDTHEDLFHVRDDIYAYVTSKGLAKKGIFQQNHDGNKNNLYVDAYNNNIKDKANDIVDRFLKLNNLDGYPEKKWQLTIFGEIYGSGVQDLGYGSNSKQFRVFDVHVNIIDDNKNGFLNMKNLMNWCIATDISHVPMLYHGPFSMDIMNKHRDGDTIVGDKTHIREGIVIKTAEEIPHNKLPNNRKQLKYINPDYLLRKGGTEYN